MIGVWSQSGPCLTLAGAIAARSVVDAVRDEIVKVKLRKARRSEGLGAKATTPGERKRYGLPHLARAANRSDRRSDSSSSGSERDSDDKPIDQKSGGSQQEKSTTTKADANCSRQEWVKKNSARRRDRIRSGTGLSTLSGNGFDIQLRPVIARECPIATGADKRHLCSICALADVIVCAHGDVLRGRRRRRRKAPAPRRLVRRKRWRRRPW